jgi:hypothetical protein
MKDIPTRANFFLRDPLHLSREERNYWEIVASASYERIAEELAELGDGNDICLLIEPGVEFEKFLLGYAEDNRIQSFRRRLPVS